MACDLATLRADACASNLDGLSERDLMLVTVAAAMELGTVISAADSRVEACEMNLPGYSERGLWELILTRSCLLFNS